MKKPLLLSIICFLLFTSAHAQEDVTFWFVAPFVSQNGGGDFDRPIYFRMTAFATAATVTISQPAGGGFPTATVTIPANSTVSFNLTTWLANVENTPANTVLNYGLLIQSTALITVYYSDIGGPSCLCNPEDFVLKGRNALGTDFWIPGQNWLDNSPSYTPLPYNAFDIVATQNGTTVTITPAQNIVGHAAGVPFTVNLNQGQTYSATATSELAANHLVGSRVTSNKPIAITEKDDLLHFYSPVTGVSGDDLIGDQIVPTNVLGTEYIPMYGALSSPFDQLFITATQPGTTISVNGVPTATIALAGGTYQMTAPNPSCYIQTNYPVYIYDLSGIASEVGSALLPQINCTGSNTVSIQQSSVTNFQVNLLVKTVGTGGFLVNGVAGVITPAMFATVPGTAGLWSAALVTLPVATYPDGSVLTISNATNLFQMGYLSNGTGGASFGYFGNYGGLDANPTTTTPSVCVGDSIMLFSDTITGGTYLWTGPGGFISTLQNPFITISDSIDSGMYRIVVNTPGCTDTDSIAIAVHPYPAVSLVNDTTLCGITSYILQNLDSVYSSDTYLWSTGATTPSITITTSGKYWLTVSNAGCARSDTDSVTLNALAPPTVSPVTYCQYATAVPLTAAGTGLRWYTVPTGGTFSTTAPTPVTTSPGIFTYYVTSTSGICESARVPLSVTINPLPPPPSVTDVNPYCLNQPFVPFTVVGTGVQWYPAATGGIGSPVTPTVNTSIPGIDTFYASQTVNGCVGPRGMTVIEVLPALNTAFTYDIHYGCHGDTVIFTNNSVGATGYSWDFGDEHSSTYGNPTHIYVNQGTYTVKLTTTNGYCDDSAFQTIPLIHPISAAFTLSPGIVCQNNPVTFTNASAGDGLTYTWLFGNGASDTASNPVYTYANSGTYTVLLIASNFVPCNDTAIASVSVDSISGIGLLVTDTVLCRRTPVTFTGLYTSIGDTGVVWNLGNGDSITNVNPLLYSFDAAGTYTVTVKPLYRACRDTSTGRKITVFPSPDLNIGPDTSICPGSNGIRIGDEVNAATSNATWKWNTGQETPTITVVSPGTYYLVVSIGGCTASDSITVQNDCYINIPNVFTPNGDGLNDYFFPRAYLSKGLVAFNMNIYNRWGQLIFTTSNIDGTGWDGKYNNVAQPEGVYVYVIDATFKDGQKDHRQGNITLLR